VVPSKKKMKKKKEEEEEEEKFIEHSSLGLLYFQ
jgi:hypothetical protein